MDRPIRVLVVDDSALMRHRLSTIIAATPGYEVAGVARNGMECLTQVAALRPDVITLDIEMPEMDGLATLGRIMQERPTPVVMVSSLTEAGADVTLDALSRGAADCLAKPSAFSPDPAGPFAAELIHKIDSAAHVRVSQLVRHAARPAVQRAPAVGPAQPATPLRTQGSAGCGLPMPLVAIGSSTGGPQALDTVLSGLSGDMPAAFLIVQHMPPLFTRSLAARLDRHSSLQVREAEEGDRLAPGVALLAPGGSHVTLGQDGRLHLDQTAPLHGVRPAIDRTLASLAECWHGRCLAVVLTGMGVDGAAGAQALRAKGAEIYAQDEATCVVYGMPRAVVAASVAPTVLPLDRMAGAIEQWMHARRLPAAVAGTYRSAPPASAAAGY